MSQITVLMGVLVEENVGEEGGEGKGTYPTKD
jgi:hypothetical protein